MTANPHERAVIDAARSFVEDPYSVIQSDLSAERVQDAVNALDAYESDLAAQGIREIGWHEVTEGDQLRGNNGLFYPVVRTLKTRTGGYEITVRLSSGDKTLSRPTEEDPTATVRRSATGQAVDMFVHVFSSGEVWR